MPKLVQASAERLTNNLQCFHLQACLQIDFRF